MNNDTKKDLVEVGTAMTVAVASGPLAAAFPAVHTAIAVAAAAAPTLIAAAWNSLQRRRVENWWTCICTASDGAALQQKILMGLESDTDNVIAGVTEGARAACAAVDMAAVPIIAELSRRFLAAEDIPRWFYRGSLEFLERLTASEIASIRLLLQETESITDAEVTIIGDVGDGPWQIYRMPDPALPPQEPIRLTKVEDADRLFSAMKRCQLGFEWNAYGYSASPDVIVVKRDVLGWLRAAFLG